MLVFSFKEISLPELKYIRLSESVARTMSPVPFGVTVKSVLDAVLTPPVKVTVAVEPPSVMVSILLFDVSWILSVVDVEFSI